MGLTEKEYQVLSDTQFLKTKFKITEKVISYFSEIERDLHKEVNVLTFDWPEGTFLKSGKISKGEQYRSLPYYILDYPRLFTQKEIFAYRTMLWWGHHLSCTLQLSGPVLAKHQEKLISNILGEQDLFFCINDQPWDYYFEPDNYLPVAELNEAKIKSHITKNGFVKISNYLSIDQWDEFKSFSLKTFARFLQYVK